MFVIGIGTIYLITLLIYVNAYVLGLVLRRRVKILANTKLRLGLFSIFTLSSFVLDKSLLFTILLAYSFILCASKKVVSF
jgi:hypothetical protein